MIVQEISLDTLTDRQLREMNHYDGITQQMDVSSVLSKLMMGLPVNHSDSFVRFALSRVMPVRDLVILDYACGLNGNGLYFAKNGAPEVHAFDISAETLKILAKAVEESSLVGKIFLKHATAEELPYDNEFFDLVYGNAVLHHLDLSRAVPEIFRVLKNSGKAIFTEPLGQNQLIEFVRQHAPYKGKSAHTPDERPLKRSDILYIGEIFPNLKVTEFDLLAGLMRFVKKSGEYPKIEKLDGIIRDYLPFSRNLFRYVVIELTK